MGRIKIIPLVFLIIAASSCKKAEPPASVTDFTASQGTYIGIIHLAAEKVEGAENYNYQRKNPQSGQWDEIFWGSNLIWDDNGWGLTDNKLIPGQQYQYRVRTHANDGGYGDYSEIITGFMFSPSPVIVNLKYEVVNADWGTYNLTYRIRDILPTGIENLQGRMVYIDRSCSADMATYYTIVAREIIYTNKDSIITGTVSDNSYNADQDYFYRLKVGYDYGYNGESNWITDRYNYISNIYSGSDITENGSTTTTDYSIQEYGNITSTAAEGKSVLKMCKEGTTVYLGYFDSFNALYGKPAVMKNNGSSWVNISGSLPAELESDNFVDEYDIDASSGLFYLAALSSDTLYVYKYGSSWSANLTTSLLWSTSENNFVDIAAIDDVLFLTLKHEDDIKVFSYQGSEWTQTGSAVASGNSFKNTKLKNIDGTLYVWYEEFVTETSETFYIKHLEGSSWVSDLKWERSDLPSGFDLVKSGGNLYFKYQTFDAKGNICKVTSSTNVQELYEGSSDFFDPISVTTDDSGNIIIDCITGTSADNFHQEVMIYNGSGWQIVKDDFTETSFHGNAGGVQASGNDIHFVYGLKSSENLTQFPTILQAKKYSK